MEDLARDDYIVKSIQHHLEHVAVNEPVRSRRFCQSTLPLATVADCLRQR